MADAPSGGASAQGTDRGWLRDPILWIAVLALVIRVVAVVATADWQQPPSDKVLRYDAIAMSLLDGDGFSKNGRPTASTGPLYPFLLAVVYGVFGYSATAIRTVLALVDVIHCVLWVLIARTCFDSRAGWLTGAAIAVCPYFVYLVVTAGNDSLFLFLHAVFVLLSVQSMRVSKGAGFLMTGIALGLATLCRAVSLLMPLFLVPFLLLRFRHSLKRGVIVGMTHSNRSEPISHVADAAVS
jgi:4-amino-4-deoxy-L-arabinose transferase-like glycosyltransferase